jgi:phosphatidylinositol-3-phosphatase
MRMLGDRDLTSNHRSRLVALLVGALLLAAGAATASTGAPGAPCGFSHARPPARYDHVIVIVMENHPFDRIAGSSPFLNGLARQCGLASQDMAITHPSLPNYLALTSGSTDGIRGDCTSCTIPAQSIFEQVGGRGWRSYLESMPQPGYLGVDTTGSYPKEHNPASYYTRIRADYAADAVPLGTPEAGALASDLAAGALRRFCLVIPNTCNSEEDCSVATGDTWLSRWVGTIVAASVYRKGRTALFITYDEGRRTNQRVYTVAVSPYTRPGTVSNAALSHYSVLKTVESMLGVRCLAHACDPTTASMRIAFGL